jgi:hypothetical protein
VAGAGQRADRAVNDLTRVDSARFALVTSIVLVVLSLGLDWGGGPGYQTIARIYLAGAVAGIAFALSRQRSDARLAGHGVTVALGSIVVMVGQYLRFLPIVPLLLMVAVVVLLLSVRFRAGTT